MSGLDDEHFYATAELASFQDAEHGTSGRRLYSHVLAVDDQMVCDKRHALMVISARRLNLGPLPHLLPSGGHESCFRQGTARRYGGLYRFVVPLFARKSTMKQAMMLQDAACNGHSPAQAAEPQTPREALVEMIGSPTPGTSQRAHPPNEMRAEAEAVGPECAATVGGEPWSSAARRSLERT